MTTALPFSDAVSIMEDQLSETTRKLANADRSLDLAFPVKEIGMERQGRGGASRWGLAIWELILEKLVNGVPPSAIRDDLVADVHRFSPKTVIRQLPSIWTIRRARSVLLIIVQTLSAYRLAKADRWGQLFTDGTDRRQVSFKNLVISVEEDELFQ